MDYERTLAQWNVAGFRIKKGAKMVGRNKSGEALFGTHQVYQPGAGYPRHSHGYASRRIRGYSYGTVLDGFWQKADYNDMDYEP